MQQQWTISWSDCDVWWKVDLYNNQQWPVQWLDWEETPNHFPKPNVHPKKVMVTVWWSAACVIHYSFLNPGETIMSEKYAKQVHELHRKLQHLQPALVNRKGPISSQCLMTACCTTNTSKVEQIGLQSFASFAIFTWLLTNWLPLLQASQQFFEGKILPQPTGGKKHFPRLHQIPKHRFFYATGINKIISHWQKCVDCNGSQFD